MRISHTHLAPVSSPVISFHTARMLAQSFPSSFIRKSVLSASLASSQDLGIPFGVASSPFAAERLRGRPLAVIVPVFVRGGESFSLFVTTTVDLGVRGVLALLLRLGVAGGSATARRALAAFVISASVSWGEDFAVDGFLAGARFLLAWLAVAAAVSASAERFLGERLCDSALCSDFLVVIVESLAAFEDGLPAASSIVVVPASPMMLSLVMLDRILKACSRREE